MEPKTLTITNFGGPLTRRNDGDIDSGLAKFDTSWGYDPYSKPGNLTWMERPVSILTLTGANGPILAMKQRSEGLTVFDNYVYALANNENLYKISVSQDTGATDNPNFDSPSVIGALADTNWTQGAGMAFYGSTEKIWFGSDSNVQKINFNGSGASTVGASGGTSSYVTTAPRPLATFLGKLYFGNGNNIGEIDSTELMTTASKLDPALPSGMYVRDLDVTPDGNYLQITATRGQSEQNPTGSNNVGLSLSESFKFYWNGVDTGVTSAQQYPGMRLTANQVVGDSNVTFGYDQNGLGILSGQQKILTLPKNISPFHGATFSTSNMLGFANLEYEESASSYRGAIYNYGQYDSEIQPGLYRLLRHNGATQNHVVTVPACVNVSNLIYSLPFHPFQSSIASTAKMYFSTVEGSVVSNTNYTQHIWRFPTVPTGLGSVVSGVYETQTQLFSKRVNVKEVRLYTDPLIGGNSFSIDLIGPGGSVLSGSSQNFTVGTNVSSLESLVRYNPTHPPTYAVGVRITNSSVTGVANWTATKLELDVVPSGK